MKGALLVTLLFLADTSGAVAQQGYQLSPPDKSFEITFPAQPRHEQKLSASGSFRTEQHAYSVENSTSKFVLSYLELTPVPADLTPTQALDAAISGTLDNVSGKLVDEKPLTIRGKPAKAATINIGQSTVMDARFVWVKPRVYQLLVLHERSSMPDFERRFFESFKLPN